MKWWLFLCPFLCSATFEAVEVLRATEANIITVLLRGTPQTVRYIGVAPPPSWDSVEGRNQWAEGAGGLARNELVAQTAYLEYGEEQYDSSGQLWAYVWTEQPTRIADDTIRANLFNAHLILAGYAAAKPKYPNLRYAKFFATYQKEAQEANRGIWSQKAHAVAPLAN